MTLLQARSRSHFSPLYAGRCVVGWILFLALASQILLFGVVTDMDVPPAVAGDMAVSTQCAASGATETTCPPADMDVTAPQGILLPSGEC